MNHYVMHDTDKSDAVKPRVLAKTYGRIEAEMLTAILRRIDPATSFNFVVVAEEQLDSEHALRVAVAAFEVDGPDPKDTTEIEILRASLERDEDEGDLRRHMVQRLLVEDAGHDHMWKDKMLTWVMQGRHQPGDALNALGVGGDMEVFERLLAEAKAEHDGWMEQMRAEKEARGS